MADGPSDADQGWPESPPLPQQVLPRTGPGSRAGSDRGLRRALASVASAASVAALGVIAGGYLVAADDDDPASARSESGDADAADSAASPTVARVLLTAEGTPDSPVTWRVRRTGGPARDAVLAAFQVYLGTTVRLSEAPDPDDPAMIQIAVDPQLTSLRSAVSRAEQAQRSMRGPVRASASLRSLRGREADVLACIDLTGQRRYGADGAPVPGVRGTRMAKLVRLRSDDGQWKVYGVLRAPSTVCRR